jgi:hypothetical protein
MADMERGREPGPISGLASARNRTDVMGGPRPTAGRTGLMGGPYPTWGHPDLMGGPHPVIARTGGTSTPATQGEPLAS